MILAIRGKAFCVGDDIDTDRIYPSRFIEITDESAMAAHALEGLDVSFPSLLASHGILVAGRNFGCGSSREHAPRSLRAAGIKAILAESFARIFYRNAINLGLPAITIDAQIAIDAGDELLVEVERGKLTNLTKETEHTCGAITGFAAEVLAAGGLVKHLQGMPSANAGSAELRTGSEPSAWIQGCRVTEAIRGIPGSPDERPTM